MDVTDSKLEPVGETSEVGFVFIHDLTAPSAVSGSGGEFASGPLCEWVNGPLFEGMNPQVGSNSFCGITHSVPAGLDPIFGLAQAFLSRGFWLP